MKKKYYYASGWFSPEQEENYSIITSMLKDNDIELFEPRYDAGEMSDGPLTLSRAKQMFSADLKGIDECSGIFADISFRDTGVLVEIGYALGKNAVIQRQIEDLVDLYKNHFIEHSYYAQEFFKLNEKKMNIILFDNSERPKMNIMLASAADSCIRNYVELQDWLNGEDVFDLGKGELR